MLNKWLQKYLGINPELEQQRYIATQAQLAQLTRGLGELTDSSLKLVESAEKLAKNAQTNSDEIAAIKEGFEYHTKEIWLIKKQLGDENKPKAKSARAKKTEE